MNQSLVLHTILSGFILMGCVSGAQLTRYKKPGDIQQPSQVNERQNLESELREVESVVATNRLQTKPNRAPNQATIYPVDGQTFRFQMHDEKVWNAVIDVLMRNYNLTVVDRKSGVITTDWDSFYLDKKVYRNRVSIRVSRQSWGQSNLSIVNNLEVLQNGAAKTEIDAVWLPAEAENSESARIIQNMASLLNQPHPTLPPSMKLSKDPKVKAGDSF